MKSPLIYIYDSYVHIVYCMSILYVNCISHEKSFDIYNNNNNINNSYVYIVCILYVYCMCIVCILYVYCMSILYVYCKSP